MSDYGKKKNDELAALCKERGLAHTGKKADLVKRLEEYDASNSSAPATAAANEDEIDWDEEPATQNQGSSAEAPAATNAGNSDEPAKTEAVPDQQTVSEAPAPAAASEEAPAKKEEPNFSTGLAARTLDEEIEKRKARARKFGMPEDSEEIKALERARKFGTDDPAGLGLLNNALPEKRERKRGGEAAQNDGGIRKKGQGRAPRGKVQSTGAGDKAKPTAKGDGRFPGWMTEKDREAAERRKARFSAA